MSDDNTKVSDNTDVSGDTNDKTDTTGSDTNQNTQKTDAKTFTQDELNNIIKQKQAEWKSKYKTEFEKTLEGKLVLTEEDRDKLVKDAVTTALKERDLQHVKSTIKTEYKLSDEQLAVLDGSDEKELRKHAETLFGAMKKKEAPVLKTGGEQREVDENEDLNTRLRKGITRRKDLL